jgi:polyisoprenoid-binding protein YceI
VFKGSLFTSFQRFEIGAGVLIACATLALPATAAFTSNGSGSLRFHAAGPAGLTIHGEGHGLGAKENDGRVEISAPVTSLETGISLRDDHLKRALEVKKYPEARLVFERAKLQLPADPGESTGTVEARLTLHGVTRPTRVTYRAKRSGSDYRVEGQFVIDVTQFAIEQPCYLGVCVDKTVKIEASLKLRDPA